MIVCDSSTYLVHKQKREGELNSIGICMQVTLFIRNYYYIVIYYSCNIYWLKKKNRFIHHIHLSIHLIFDSTCFTSWTHFYHHTDILEEKKLITNRHSHCKGRIISVSLALSLSLKIVIDKMNRSYKVTTKMTTEQCTLTYLVLIRWRWVIN